jgi:phosphoribosyl 1,2-cyclic phosphate phosphodiesterase
MTDAQLIFLGTGTSAGVPMIGCHCEVCASADPHDKRTRPSVAICGTSVSPLRARLRHSR